MLSIAIRTRDRRQDKQKIDQKPQKKESQEEDYQGNKGFEGLPQTPGKLSLIHESRAGRIHRNDQKGP